MTDILEFLIDRGEFPIKISAGGLEIHIYEGKTPHNTLNYPFQVILNGFASHSKAYKKMDILDMVMDLVVRTLNGEIYN